VDLQKYNVLELSTRAHRFASSKILSSNPTSVKGIFVFVVEVEACFMEPIKKLNKTRKIN
jgi:hypothetical protein